MQKKYFVNKKCRISYTWLLIYSIVIVSAVSACTPTAVRTSNNYKINPQNKQKKNDIPDAAAEDKIKEFEEKMAANQKNELLKNEDMTYQKEEESVEKLSIAQIMEQRLPTLREQMQSLSETQVVMGNKINTIQNDINDIKYSIEEIKTALIKSNQIEPRRVVAGEPKENLDNSNENRDDTEKAPSAKPASNILLPDETQSKPKAKSATAAKPKKIAAATPAQTATRNKPVSDVMIETPSVESPSPPKVMLTQALNDLSKKDYNESINKLKVVLSSSKDDETLSEANFYMAENQRALNNFDQAREHYSAVLKSKGTDKKDDAAAGIAECLLKSGNTTDAITAFKSLITKFPKSEFVPKARKMLQQM